LTTFRLQQTEKATLKFVIFKALKTKQESKKVPNPNMPKNYELLAFLSGITFKLILFTKKSSCFLGINLSAGLPENLEYPVLSSEYCSSYTELSNFNGVSVGFKEYLYLIFFFKIGRLP
jgi:hypothetical protein